MFDELPLNQPQEPTPITLSVPHSQVTVSVARLNFCRQAKCVPFTRPLRRRFPLHATRTVSSHSLN
jgi:hypothetical protein